MSSSYRVTYQLKPHRRDQLIEFMKALLLTPFVLNSQLPIDSEGKHPNEDNFAEVLLSIQLLIQSHRQLQLRQEKGEDLKQQSKLQKMVPSIGIFFTDLPLKDTFLAYNNQYHIASRRHVPPSFNDCRRLLNFAQIHAIAKQLKLITFDGDCTLYEDGGDFSNSKLSDSILSLLTAKNNLKVAIVTAAGYKNNAKRYEERLSGLLQHFKDANLSDEVLEKFFVLGGECNYLYQCTTGAKLVSIPDDQFVLPKYTWSEESVKKVMDVAEETFLRCIDTMKLPATVYRKERGIGLIRKDAQSNMSREQLDEVVFSAQTAIREQSDIPFCAFNGGSDVWVDVGNKLIGVKTMQKYCGTMKGHETLHVGDQFLSTGNDHSTRGACATVWISSPQETQDILTILLDDMKK